MDRPVEATSVAGFVQQLAVSYIGRGYYFYVTGSIPSAKAPEAVDAKLCERYGVFLSKWAKSRRKAARVPNYAYIRYGRFFVLLSTDAGDLFRQEEANLIRDARRTPIRFQGYSISHRGGRVHVRIDQDRYLELKGYLTGIALRRTSEEMVAEIRRSVAFEPYAPVRSQMLCILRAINRLRAAAGLPEVPRTCLRFRRRVVKPFAPFQSAEAA